MKIQITILAILMSSLGFTQTSIKKSSIDSGGAIAQNGTISILYTVGELAVQETTNGTIHISEGFISPEMLDALDVKSYTSLTGISIFPNPTVDYVTVHFTNSSNYLITITDLTGKKINSFTTNDSQFQIEMSNYSNGVYLVLVKDISNKKYKVYKILKE